MSGTSGTVQIKSSVPTQQARKAIFDELRQDLAEWMTTDQDRVCRPHIELTKRGNEYIANVFISDADAKDIKVSIAPEILLIQGRTDNRKLLCSRMFPQLVNPDKVQAEIRDGILSIRIAMAKQSLALVPMAA